jgi:putative hydrolase of the HAD superfamily
MTVCFQQSNLMLFDLDDTLCDYASARARRIEYAFRLAANHDGVKLPDDLQPLVTESIARHPHGAEHFGELLLPYGISAEAVAIGKQWFVTHRFYTLELFPDAIATIGAVRAAQKHRKIGVVTNGPTDVQRQKIDLLDLRPHVDFFVISDEFGYWKPDREIFDEALRLGSATPGESVFIGDSAEHDIAGAQSAGIPAIWINRNGAAWQLESPAPTCIARNLADVRRFLRVGE